MLYWFSRISFQSIWKEVNSNGRHFYFFYPVYSGQYYCILHMQMVRKTEQATLKHKKRRAATLRFLYSNGIRVFISFIVSQVYYDLYSLSRTNANPLFSFQHPNLPKGYRSTLPRIGDEHILSLCHNGRIGKLCPLFVVFTGHMI